MTHKFTLEKLAEEIAEARAEAKAGKVHSEEEAYEQLKTKNPHLLKE